MQKAEEYAAIGSETENDETRGQNWKRTRQEDTAENVHRACKFSSKAARTKVLQTSLT